MKNQDVLTVSEIREIKDLNKLNTLIKQYEKELNRRMKILQKYEKSDEKLYKKAEATFSSLAVTPGFRTAKIETPETSNIIVARARLINLSQTLRGGNTQIRTLRKSARIAKIKRERQLYETLNRDEKRVTRNDIHSLTSDDWTEIRRLIKKYEYIDSDEIIMGYVENPELKDDELIKKIMNVIEQRQAELKAALE